MSRSKVEELEKIRNKIATLKIVETDLELAVQWAREKGPSKGEGKSET